MLGKFIFWLFGTNPKPEKRCKHGKAKAECNAIKVTPFGFELDTNKFFDGSCRCRAEKIEAQMKAAKEISGGEV